MSRQLLIDAIKGAGLPKMEYAIAMERAGNAERCGNQHNPDWRWSVSALGRMSDTELARLYEEVKSL